MGQSWMAFDAGVAEYRKAVKNQTPTVLDRVHVVDSEVHVVRNEVHVVNNEDDAVRNEIHVVKSEVHVVRNEVHVVKSEVYLVRNEVHVVKSEVYLVRNEDNAVNSEVDLVRNKGNAAKINLVQVQKWSKVGAWARYTVLLGQATYSCDTLRLPWHLFLFYSLVLACFCWGKPFRRLPSLR
jgi:uncharacterized protein (DUF3084 family)